MCLVPIPVSVYSIDLTSIGGLFYSFAHSLVNSHATTHEWMNEWLYPKNTLNIQQRRQQVVKSEDKKYNKWMHMLFIDLVSWIWARPEKRGFQDGNRILWGVRQIANIYSEIATASRTSKLNYPDECSNVHWNFHLLSLSSPGSLNCDTYSRCETSKNGGN